MTAPTVSVRRVYAHTTTRNGRMHLCSQRDSGALVPVCGANQIRGRKIAIHDAAPDGVALCIDCRDLTPAPAVKTPPAVRAPRHRAAPAPTEPSLELRELATLIGRFFNIRTRISRHKIVLDLNDADLTRLLDALR